MTARARIRLGVNLDHVATLRNARDEGRPDLLRAVEVAIAAGADGITLHLREDRRHVRDADVTAARLRLGAGPVLLNMEMAATEEMVRIALRERPHWVCLVPERRAERTTEHGLDVSRSSELLRACCAALSEAGIRVSLFVDPSPAQLEAAASLGVSAVEVHTGTWCNAVRLRGFSSSEAEAEWARLSVASGLCASLGMPFHAGHGLDYETAERIASLPGLEEVNIGHFLIGESVFVGLPEALSRMRSALARGLASRSGEAAA